MVSRFLKQMVERYLRRLISQLYAYDPDEELYVAYGEGEVSKNMMEDVMNQVLDG